MSLKATAASWSPPAAVVEKAPKSVDFENKGSTDKTKDKIIYEIPYLLSFQSNFLAVPSDCAPLVSYLDVANVDWEEHGRKMAELQAKYAKAMSKIQKQRPPHNISSSDHGSGQYADGGIQFGASAGLMIGGAMGGTAAWVTPGDVSAGVGKSQGSASATVVDGRWYQQNPTPMRWVQRSQSMDINDAKYRNILSMRKQTLLKLVGTTSSRKESTLEEDCLKQLQELVSDVTSANIDETLEKIIDLHTSEAHTNHCLRLLAKVIFENTFKVFQWDNNEENNGFNTCCLYTRICTGVNRLLPEFAGGRICRNDVNDLAFAEPATNPSSDISNASHNPQNISSKWGKKDFRAALTRSCYDALRRATTLSLQCMNHDTNEKENDKNLAFFYSGLGYGMIPRSFVVVSSELQKKGLLAESVTHVCLSALLDFEQETLPANIFAACSMLMTVAPGMAYNHACAAMRVSDYIRVLERILVVYDANISQPEENMIETQNLTPGKKPSISQIVIDILRNTIDLSKHRWVPQSSRIGERLSAETVKEELELRQRREKAQAEARAQAKILARERFEAREKARKDMQEQRLQDAKLALEKKKKIAKNKAKKEKKKQKKAAENATSKDSAKTNKKKKKKNNKSKNTSLDLSKTNVTTKQKKISNNSSKRIAEKHEKQSPTTKPTTLTTIEPKTPKIIAKKSQNPWKVALSSNNSNGTHKTKHDVDKTHVKKVSWGPKSKPVHINKPSFADLLKSAKN